MSVCPVAAELVENPYQADLSASGNDGYFVTDEYSVSADVVYHVAAEEVYHVEAAAYVTPADAYTGEPTEYAVDIDEYIITPSVNGYPYWTFVSSALVILGVVAVTLLSIYATYFVLWHFLESASFWTIRDFITIGLAKYFGYMFGNQGWEPMIASGIVSSISDSIFLGNVLKV